MFFYSFKCFIISLLSFSLVNSELDVGDYCTLQPAGENGECTLLTNCQAALAALRQNHLPQTCGFKDTIPIVCCKQSTQILSSTTVQNIKTTIRSTTASPSMKISAKSDATPGEISRQKCVEYGQYVFSKKKPVILLVDAPETTRNECGFTVVELVVGGEKAKVKEFPHMALIGFEPVENEMRYWECGGSIISDLYIITAAHCLYHRELGAAKYVKVGITKRNDRPYKQEIKISKLIHHPNYSASSYYHDIALVKLERPISLNPYARPACLFTKETIPAKSAIATGWGATDYEGSTSSDLLKVILELSPRSKCNDSHKINWKLQRGIDFDSMLCAGAGDDGDIPKDTCQGDSGGPLQIYHLENDVNCMYDIIGITSFGKSCGMGKLPAVYTKISHYIKWIEDIVWS